MTATQTITHQPLVNERTYTMASGRELCLEGRDARTCPDRPFRLDGERLVVSFGPRQYMKPGAFEHRAPALNGQASLAAIEGVWAAMIHQGLSELDARGLIVRILQTVHTAGRP